MHYGLRQGVFQPASVQRSLEVFFLRVGSCSGQKSGGMEEVGRKGLPTFDKMNNIFFLFTSRIK